MRWRSRLAPIFTVGLAFAGCAPGICPLTRFSDPTRALESYRSMRSYLDVMRAEARVDHREGSGRIRGTVFILLERPDRVRFDAMTQLGPAAVLTSNGEQFALTDLREDHFYTGPTCPSNIARLLGLEMSGEEIAKVLTGEVALLDGEPAIECDGGRYIIEIASGDERQRLELEVRQSDVEESPELQRMRLRKSERWTAGRLMWRIRWDDYRFVADPRSESTPRMGIAMPHRIQVEQPSAGLDTLIHFESIQMNREPPSDAFSQHPRAGLAVERVECQ